MESVEALTQFGLTRQEAAIYLALVTNSALTGYEAAKLTGISRSNTYNALAGLCEKGAAEIVESAPTKYVPVPPGEFCGNRIRRLEATKELLMKSIPEPRAEAEEYITVKGERHILDKMANMLEGAKERVYLSVAGRALEAVMPQLLNILQRELKLVVITPAPFFLEGAIVYHSERDPRQIRLIVDSTCVLTGDISDGEASTCLYSKKKNLVELFKESMKNEIKLAESTERN